MNIAIALLLLLNAPQASAEDIDCSTLKDAITASAQDFVSFRGKALALPLDPELAKLQDIKGFDYRRDEYLTERRLAAAASCSVIVARAEDPESIISEARFRCIWPSTGKAEVKFDAIRKSIQACGITAQAEEDDDDNYTLNIDRVESGEGWSGVSVTADREVAYSDTGASVSVIHVVCQRKTASSCDDAY